LNHSSYAETFIDYKITENVLKRAVICVGCVTKIDNYDEHSTIANLIRDELRRKHRNETESHFASIKLEDDEPPALFFDEHKEIVEVKIEVRSYEDNALSPANGFPTSDDFFDYGQPESSKKSKVVKDQLGDIFKDHPKVSRTPRKTSRKTPDDESMSGYQIHEIDGVKHYQCEVCKKVMQRKADFKIHLHSHGTERNFICDVSRLTVISS
jgi:hypothetical protein